MVASTFDVSARSRVTPARKPRTDGECLRYRLQVVAASAEDIVHSAGGWLYDRVMAGWEVTAVLPSGGATRPLRILGVGTPESLPGAAALTTANQGLAVSAEAFLTDARVRAQVLASLDDRLTEVALWGDGWPLSVRRATAEADHLLSAAARKFKHCALAAAGLHGASVGPTETLLCGATARLQR